MGGRIGGLPIISRGSQQDTGPGMRCGKGLQALDRMVGADVIREQAAGEGLGGQDQHGGAGRRPGSLFILRQQAAVLLLLRIGFEFLIRVQVGLADNHLQRRPLLREAAAGGPDHRPEESEDGARKGGDTGLGIPPGHPAVGERHHQAEEGKVAHPHPQGAAQGAQDGVPLDEAGSVRERVAQHQPRPGNLGRCQIEPLPGNPGSRQVQIGECAPAAALHPAEAAEDHAHLQGVGQDGEHGAAHGGPAHPPGSDGVPQHKAAVVPPPEVLYLIFRSQPLQDEQRQQADKSRPAHVRHQPRQAHEHRECQAQGDKYKGTVLHREQSYE